MQDASRRDRNVIIPLVLLVILVVLGVLLRALVAPLLLILTVVLSFAATLGVCALFFNHVFGFAGADPSFPLFAFVFLVALGIDYNIFLMTRVREETLGHGTRSGVLRGLTVTGGVITSAGIVLASTFAVLGVLPLVFLAEVGFAVAFGVLLDTLLVRSVLVPALAYDIGKRIWWPSAGPRARLALRRAARTPPCRRPGPSGPSGVGARGDAAGAGSAADRRVAVELQRVDQHAVVGDVGVVLLLRPGRERVDLDLAALGVPLDDADVAAGVGLVAADAGGPGGVGRQPARQRLDLADGAARVGVAVRAAGRRRPPPAGPTVSTGSTVRTLTS